MQEKLLKRYLDNHCQASDQEGMSVLCECQLCRDTRMILDMRKIMPNGQRTIGRREIDIWREQQIKRCEELVDTLEILVGSMHDDEVKRVYTIRYWTKRLEDEIKRYRIQK